MNKLLMTVASLAIAAAPLAASAQSFDHNRGGADRTQGGGRQAAHDNGAGRNYGHGDDGRGWNNGDRGPAVAAGVAGLFLGAALANSQDYGYGQSYGYAQPYAYDQGYGCAWRTEAVQGRYGEVEYRRVNACE